jgi:AcrR family transcriptional regulator
MARRALKPGELPTRDILVGRAAEWFGGVCCGGCPRRERGSELGVTAPTLLHHVGSKQQLYAKVLAYVADSLSAAIAQRAVGDDDQQVMGLLDAYFAWSRAHEAYARLLMRELLDNHARATSARYWPLAGVVRRVTTQVHRIRGGSRVDAAMVVFQAIGAIAYFAAAEPTLRAILGIGPQADLERPFRAALLRAMRAGLDRRSMA